MFIKKVCFIIIFVKVTFFQVNFMKRIFILTVLVSFFSISCEKKEQAPKESVELKPEPTAESVQIAKTPEEEGKDLIAGADCLTCHKVEGKLIGPSYQEVATKYTAADIDMLADKIVNGGSGVWGDVPMAAHPGMDKENAKKMVKYILAQKK